MPLRIVVDHHKLLVKIEATGRIEAVEVFDNLHRLQLEGVLAYPKLFDARRMQVGFRPDEVMAFAASINGLGAVEVLGALAVIATSDQTTDIARRYINLSQGQRPVRLFSNLTKALKWLEGQTPQTFRGTARILVVDDDHTVLEEAVEMLSSLGYHAIPAASGAEALAVLERDQNVDLLFTDVVMPGQPTARALAARALEMRPGLKVLFVSGYFEGMLIDREQLGADVEFLPKPYRKKELAQKIKNILSSAA